MYIAYNMRNGIEYATISSSVRRGSKIVKGTSIYLGRVLDKERGIYRSRERGIFTYDLATNEFGPPPADFTEPSRGKKGRGFQDPKISPPRVLTFGDVFFYDQFVRRTGILDTLVADTAADSQNLPALLCYYVTSPDPIHMAPIWQKAGYGGILYPEADLSIRSAMETLYTAGRPDNMAAFYRKYLKFLTNRTGVSFDDEEEGCILMDLGSHSGILPDEGSLLCAVHPSTGLPLFLRYSSEKVTTVLAIRSVISELQDLGIRISFSCLNGDYYYGRNADELYEEDVPFLVRVPSHHRIFEETVTRYRTGLEVRENLVLHKGGMYYIQQMDMQLGVGEQRKAWGYLCLDVFAQGESLSARSARAEDQDVPPGETCDRLQEEGLFLLISSRPRSREQILSLYDAPRETIDLLSPKYRDPRIPPLKFQDDHTLQGHLILTLLSGVIGKILREEMGDSEYTPQDLFSILRRQGAVESPEALYPGEQTEEMSQIYEHFGIQCPEEMAGTDQNGENETQKGD